MDYANTDYDEVEVEVDEQGRDMPTTDYALIQHLQMEALRRKQEQLQKALVQKHLEEQLIEEELNQMQPALTIQQQQPELRSGTRYVQHVALPKGVPDDKAYMYSSVMSEVILFLNVTYVWVSLKD